MVVVDSIGLVEEWGYDDFGGYHWTLSGTVIDGQQYGVIDGVDEQDGPDELPKATRLEQCFPNPFNPATVIGYRVGQGEDLGTGRLGEGGSVLVQLSVYDILGREVATLVNERQAPGSYTVTFDGAGLASGVYLYRLQAGGFTETKRMMLVR